MNASLLKTANLYQERSIIYYVFSEEMEGGLIVSAIGNFPAQQHLRVRGESKRELKIGWNKESV